MNLPYPYGPHFGYEQAAPQYWTGDLSDVTPLGVFVPPLGIAQAFGGGGRSGMSSSPPPRKGHGIPWSTVALIGILAGGALAIYTIYRGTKASEPFLRKTGEGAARALVARYGVGASSARKTILPPEPKPKLLEAPRPAPWPSRPRVPRPKAAYTIRALPEYEAYR